MSKMGDLGDFFSLVAEEEKKKKEIQEANLKKEAAQKEVIETLGKLLSQMTPEDQKSGEVSEETVTANLKQTKAIFEMKRKIADLEKLINTKVLESENDLGLVGGSTKKNTSDPLTPLAQNFVTQEDLQKHYKTYIARIQQQMSSLGGGGSTRILDNDDVVFNKPNELSHNDVLIFDADIKKFKAINMVDVINNIRTELEVQYDKLISETVVEDIPYTYIGEALPGTLKTDAVWRIKRVAELADGLTEVLWANNADTFDRIWTDRETYEYTN